MTGIFWAAPIADVLAMAVTAVVMLKLWRELGTQAPAARSAYYRAITGMEWDRCEGYDLCIDSSIGEDAVAEVLYQYLKARKAA